jgi:hypothetical protein
MESVEGITGGYVLFGKTVKTGDYENERAEVRLDFADDRVLSKASDLAKAKVFELLGVKKAAKAKVADEPAAPGSTVVTEDGKIKAGKKQAPATAPATDPSAVVEVTTPAPAKIDPAAVVEDWEPKPEAAPAEITDKELVGTFSRKVNAADDKNKMAAKIKEVIATYVKLPQTAKDIPQAQRAEFLKKIEAL